MSNLEKLLKTSFSVALESVPYAGKVFEVLRKMEEDQKIGALERISLENVGQLKDVFAAIENIETRVHNLAQSVRELKEYDRDNGFVMLPRLLYEDPAFREFWFAPEEFGGTREPLPVAAKKDSHFSVLMTDMLGEKWVYHIPIQTFGLLLQNQALKGESPKKSLGFDATSQTHWIAEEQPDLFQIASSPIREQPNSQVQKGIKVGKNDRCPCGSGKKYKKCHGRSSSLYIVEENPPVTPVSHYQPPVVDNLREEIRQIIATTMGISAQEIPERASLAEIGMDELDFVETIMELEEHYNCTLPDIGEGEPLPTLDEFVKMVRLRQLQE